MNPNNSKMNCIWEIILFFLKCQQLLSIFFISNISIQFFKIMNIYNSFYDKMKAPFTENGDICWNKTKKHELKHICSSIITFSGRYWIFIVGGEKNIYTYLYFFTIIGYIQSACVFHKKHIKFSMLLLRTYV